ncbi:Hypothetical predicted protein [Podarcis lilfordi]|uniref:Uncharacterized protein n=1 Tax=Podarcis lilfordi TaxID=74358 RepID=A0AA35PEH6_9SAUR|nr:Hypothetical predicted protein [Podarcis lilfordi]
MITSVLLRQIRHCFDSSWSSVDSKPVPSPSIMKNLVILVSVLALMSCSMAGGCGRQRCTPNAAGKMECICYDENWKPTGSYVSKRDAEAPMAEEN